jgi:hypothetical protein
MNTGQVEMKARVGAVLEEKKSLREEMKACPEKREPISDEMGAVAERQEVHNEEAAVETVGVLEDRPGGQEPAVGYRNPRKRRNKGGVIRGTRKGRTFAKRRRTQRKFNNGIG